MLVGLLALVPLIWAGESLASESACLNDLSLELSSTPDGSVQPSNLGGTKTYVRYSAVLRNVRTSGTSRHVYLTLSLSPATAFSNLQTAGHCQIVGSTVSCTEDKLQPSGPPLTVMVTAEAPTTSPSQMVLTGQFGNQFSEDGHTQTVVYSLPVTKTSGRTYVPANTVATVVTSEETSNPANQTTPAMPLFGKVTAPKQPNAYLLSIAINSDPDGPDFNCPPLGLFLDLSAGGPFLCRTTADGRTAVEIDAQATFTAGNPLKVEVIADDSIISALQLAPTFLTPKGTPSYAFFYSGLTNNLRAEAGDCGNANPTAPCVLSRDAFSTGDWRITFLKANDGSEPTGGLAFLNLTDIIFGKKAMAQIAPKIRTR